MTPEEFGNFQAGLTAAGFKWDGHVTIGSLNEQTKFILQWFGLPVQYSNLYGEYDPDLKDAAG